MAFQGNNRPNDFYMTNINTVQPGPSNLTILLLIYLHLSHSIYV